MAKAFLEVLNGERYDPPPIWLMRQAGRYLPEYREMRVKAGGFLDLCYTPDFAVEVTIQPIERYGFDAAILFSDILVVPDGLGQEVSFVEGTGPFLSRFVMRRLYRGCRPMGYWRNWHRSMRRLPRFASALDLIPL